jgi:hypothetical protein
MSSILQAVCASERRVVRVSGLFRAARALTPVALGLAPLALSFLYLAVSVPHGNLGLDFRASFWPAAHAVLQGHSPYPALDRTLVGRGDAFVYPPIVAIVLAPAALLPVGVATAIALVVTVLAIAGSAWILGVRDWRCYGVLLASPAVLACVQTAALSGLLALGIALAWHYRARGIATPLLVVCLIAAKLFLWPLVVWLCVVRGARCAAATAVASGFVVVFPWLLGFPGAREYPTLLSMLTNIEASRAYTPRALVEALGATPGLAEAVAIAVGGLLLIGVVALRDNREAPRRAFALALCAAFALSPIVWTHYFVLLIPLVAIAQPRMHAAWFALWALWLAGGAAAAPNGLQIAVSLLVVAAVTIAAFAPTRRPATRALAWCRAQRSALA